MKIAYILNKPTKNESRKSMLTRSHQITIRLLHEDKARLEKLCRMLDTNLQSLQIKFIDRLLNNKEKYISRYLNKEYQPDLLTLDEGTSVSVRLNSHTFQVLRKLVEHMETSNSSLLRYYYQENFQNLEWLLGKGYMHIDKIDESEYKNR